MIHVIASIVLALLFLVTGGGKVLSLGSFATNREKLGLSLAFWKLTGSLEVAGAVGMFVGLFLVPIGVAAASGLTLLMIGAIVARVRASQSGIAVDIVVGLLTAATAVAIVLGV